MSSQVKQLTERIYFPKVIPDTLTPKIEKLSEERKTRENNERIEDIKNLRLVKQQRIQNTKEDRYVHAINTIIEWTGAGKRTIPYLYFNFHFEEQQEFALFLDKLKNAGCFSDWSVNPYKDAYHAEFIFSEIKVKRLIIYRNRLVKDNATTPSKIWTKTDLKNEIERLKRITKLTIKETKLLTLLFDLNSHPLDSIKVAKSRNALKELKSSLNKKIAGTEWTILNTGRGYHSISSYILTPKSSLS